MRYFKVSALLAMMLLNAVLLVGLLQTRAAVSKDQTVEAEKFVLVDKAGKPRATLGLAEDGSVALTMSDINQKVRAKLSVQGDQLSRLEFLAPDGKSRVILDDHAIIHESAGKEVERMNTCGLSLFEGKGDPRRELPRVWISLNDGVTALGVRDENGKEVWMAPPREGK